jgi:hypothetical protein
MDFNLDTINALAAAVIAILAALTAFLAAVRPILAELKKNTAATHAAKDAAETAVEQTNGALDARIQGAITEALERQQASNVADQNPGQGTLL